jgi:DedD protein
MRDGNVRIREKFELSLDGRQIASIVVGALVILSVVFVLGLNVGRQRAVRQPAGAPGGDLAALDQVPAPDAQAKITFYDQLPKGRPPAPPPPQRPEPTPAAAAPSPPVASAAVAVAESAPASGTTVTAAVATPSAAAPSPAPEDADHAAPAPAASPPPAPAPAHAGRAAPASGSARPGYTVQIAAATTRADAERVVARYPALGARVEPAEVAGKGRVFRVRAGRFPDRVSAERYLKDAVRETGAKGFVAEAR